MHIAQASFSLNLLGGLNEDRLGSESDEMYFDIHSENVRHINAGLQKVNRLSLWG